MIALLAAALLGGVGRRVAGGAFQQWTGIDVGDVPARAFFGAAVGIGALLAGVDNWLVLAVVTIGTFLSCSIPIHFTDFGMDFGGIAMGRNPRHSWRNDAGGLLLHAVLGIGGTAVLVEICGGSGLPLFVAALSIVPFYEVGWRVAGVEGISFVPARTGLRTGSELGEFMWGAACGVAAGGFAWV